MATVPTNRMERELRALYLRWLAGLPSHPDLTAYISQFQAQSTALISKLGGQVASLGALADFPVPKTLTLSPVAGVVYDQMKQAAISASITAGINSKVAARQMLHAGLGKSYNRLERLARTETVSAYWKNQWDSTLGLGLVMVWGAEQGKRTCDYCLSRDGLVVEDGNVRDHPNGRCTLIPTLLSQLKYKGTLQPDGRITMDPKYGKPVGKAKPLPKESKPTAEQRDPLSGKSNPAAPSVAQPAQQVNRSIDDLKATPGSKLDILDMANRGDITSKEMVDILSSWKSLEAQRAAGVAISPKLQSLIDDVTIRSGHLQAMQAKGTLTIDEMNAVLTAKSRIALAQGEALARSAQLAKAASKSPTSMPYSATDFAKAKSQYESMGGKLMSEVDMNNMFERYTKNMPSKAFNTMDEYFGNAQSWDINAALRNGAAPGKLAKDIESVIQSYELPENVRAYRVLFDMEGLPDNLVGAQWKDKAFQSTTINKNHLEQVTGAMDRAGDPSVVMEIIVPKGAKVALNSDEYEVLLQRGSKIRIVEDSTVGNVRTLKGYVE